MSLSELWVTLCSDTEDNYPSYVPGWASYGSDYDKNPADLRWDWTRLLPSLKECFKKLDIPITWLIRVDDGPAYDLMLRKFKEEILGLASTGDEIGIHIHTFIWDRKSSRWKQTRNPVREAQIVSRSLEYFREVLGFSPLSVRMGWNAMNNEIMNALNEKRVLVDASAVPGNYCNGKFGRRDNFYDWRRCPKDPYNPSHLDYQSPGSMQILEMPISTAQSIDAKTFGYFVNGLSSFNKSYALKPLLSLGDEVYRRFMSPHSFFYVSPWWSTSVIERIIAAYAEKAINKGVSFLVGCFHSSDILDPERSALNSFFLRKMERIGKIFLALKRVDVVFSTLSQAAEKYMRSGVIKQIA